VTFTNDGQTSYPLDEFYFTLISTSNSIFNPTFVEAIQQNLPTLNIAQGQKASGQVAFQIPTSETPYQLEYHIPFSINEFITNLPTPTSFVSEPSLSVNINVNGTANAYGGQDLYASASILNNTFFFYSGQTIAIKVALTDLNTGTNVTVNSITSNTTGISVSQISPSLPVIAIGGGLPGVEGEVDVTVYMIAPTASFTGEITLTVNSTG